MLSVEIIPGVEKEGIRGMMEGVNSTMIYYNNFCKCQNVPPVQ
jgi:hypothetical protein